MRQAKVGEPDPDGFARDFDAETRARFEALALPYLSDVYRLAVRLKGSAQDAEDLVQETYVKALKAFGTLRQPDRIRPGSFRS